MLIDKTSEVPRYSQLKSILKQKIRLGDFKTGDRIPAERELAEQYGVSRITANRAVRDLVQEGLLVREQGKGTFVCGGSRAPSMNVACVVKGLQEQPSSYYLEMFKGVEQAISPHGYNLVFASLAADDSEEATSLRMLQERPADGLILVELWGREHLLDPRPVVPVVLLDWDVSNANVDCVTVDDRQAARLATACLLGLGHRRIGFVAGDGNILFYRERVAGYQEALEDAGLAYDEQLVCWGGPWFEDGLKRMKRLVDAGITAITGGSDCLVDGALEVLRSLGKRIPEEVSAVGLGGSPAPPESFLTTVGIDWVEMGRQAGDCLLARISGSSAPGRRIRVPGRLIQRRSCANRE